MKATIFRFARRSIAYLIDSTLVFLFIRPEVIANVGFRPVSSTWAAALDVLSIVLGALYVVGCHSKWGCTVGKKLFGLRVATTKGLSPPSLRQALLRFSPFLVIGVALFLLDWFVLPHWHFGVVQIGEERVSVWQLVPFVWVLLDVGFALRAGGYRSLHDMIGGTIVTDAATVTKSA